jgi:hypothetical protein
MRMLAMIRTKEQLMAVLKQLPEDDSDISEFVTTIRDLFEQLVFHEDKTVLCNLELVRRGVDLTHPE